MLKKFIALAITLSSTAGAEVLTVHVDSLTPHCVENFVEYTPQGSRVEMPFKCWYESVNISVERCSSLSVCSSEALFYQHNCYTRETIPNVTDSGVIEFLTKVCRNGDESQNALYHDYIRLQEEQESGDSIVLPENEEHILFEPII